MKVCVYKILNVVNGKFYIGSTVNFVSRWRDHKKLLRKGKHHSIYLQRAWDKYGELNFEFKIILSCLNVISKIELLKYEQCFMDNEKPAYNLAPFANSRLGVISTEETKEKIRIARKNQIFSEESRIKMGNSHRRENLSEETLAKMRKSPSAETLVKRSNALKNRIITPEHAAKISAAQKGKPFTEEHLANVIASNKRPVTDETRNKMSESAKRREKRPPLSAETKLKMSISKKKLVEIKQILSVWSCAI